MTHVLRILAWLFILLGSALTATLIFREMLMAAYSAASFALAIVCITKLEDLEKP